MNSCMLRTLMNCSAADILMPLGVCIFLVLAGYGLMVFLRDRE